ncbi:EAL domain-containing protein [Leptolyngbya sp. FACHB-711]|uniref:bifunctional diguanylate cyclase/phosphodiesterase n=1 Tax=unclassified Leptolyngbya TaxID=2650499 RepID=UPI001682DB69|nr:EAL domain-containing protein [Leptolyngbya sp. FACHB-711]MBD2027569.1 EAL domain-containing protein [Leptolyngbya sp. FACHB-711]
MSETAFDQEHLLHCITSRIRQSLELQEILTTAAQEIRGFLDIDRVKVYRFEPDGSGIVIAESIQDARLPSLLGLRFPAGDIPSQARELFLRTRQRVIVDVSAQRKTLNALDCQETGQPLLIEDLRYAPVDPCHVQYLLAMGVMASLVLPIVHKQQLWGLVAIHHASPRHFSKQELQMVQLLIDQVSIAIAQSTLLKQVQQQAYHEATINRISSLLHCPLSQAEIRQVVLEETVKALDGSGGRLYLVAEPGGEPAQLYTFGEQPSEAFIEEGCGWQQVMGGQYPLPDQPVTDYAVATIWKPSGHALMPLSFLGQTIAARGITERNMTRQTLSQQNDRGQGSRESVYSENGGLLPPAMFTNLFQDPQFRPLAAAFQSTPIRSVLVIPLQYHHQRVGWLSVFRNGYDTEILWAGRQNPDERNQFPRRSFEAWRELKTDQSPEWSQEVVKLAQTIGIHLYMATMQKRVEELLRHEASHDRLTKLPNRLLFDEQLSLALVSAQQRGETLAVAFLDLDRFKTVNDTLGHAVGDQLLQQVTKRLQGCLRQCDTISRWGGDEFTLLFPHIGYVDDVNKLTQRVLDVLSAPFYLESQELYVSASLGIALFPYDGEDVETLLKHADTAMYRAKQQGRNNYQIYSPEMNLQARERLELETDLRKAMIKNEFLLHYQPQVDIYTSEISSMEALIRWQHPQLGLVPPNQFIPLAEETGLIGAIGAWVIETACAQHQAWRAAGLPPIRVAVNLSADQFQQRNLVKTIVQILQKTKVEPQYLELEITESMAMQDVNFTISVLQELQRMGIQIAMDDFGTGYSSLNSIKHLPLNTLKIDKSFVRDLITDPSDTAIAKAVVALGQGLNLKTLAEGVETVEQLEFLRLLGCDVAQGYLFSKPLPAEAVVDFVLNHTNAVTSRIQLEAAELPKRNNSTPPKANPASPAGYPECKHCPHVKSLQVSVKDLKQQLKQHKKIEGTLRQQWRHRSR